MAQKRKISLTLIPLTLAAGMVGGIFIGQFLNRTTLTPGQQKLQTVLGLINREYVDRIDCDSLLETLYPELLAGLDPHSAYISAAELTDVNSDLEGAFSGVGISFQILNDTVFAVDVISGGPAEKVGLKAGDRILSADEFDLTGSNATNENVFKHLRGEKESKVVLKVLRGQSRTPLSFEVIRGEVPVASVNARYMLGESTGYVKVSKFSRNTYNEFLEAMLDLKSRGAQDFVIDLRGNAGGFMDQAIYMANEFLPEDRMIVYTKGRTPENETQAVSDGRGTFRDAGVVVLTDEYSASASEIFAGAIQDNDRGLIVGRRSFGKGLVQNQTMLPDSSAIRLTVARYYIPSGRSIQKEYVRGEDGKYQLEIADRYSRGEFYNADSIRLDKSKLFHTIGGREVFGGGGIMPDIFVPEDTVGVTNYYIKVANKGLLQKYAYQVADKFRELAEGIDDTEHLTRILPRDNTLLNNFVKYAAQNGVPARWYYINQSRDLILNQLKAIIARDLIGDNAFFEILNINDPALDKAVKALEENQLQTLMNENLKEKTGKSSPKKKGRE